jgi:hypothetical protein
VRLRPCFTFAKTINPKLTLWIGSLAALAAFNVGLWISWMTLYFSVGVWTSLAMVLL